MSSKSYVFTLNNYTDDQVAALADLVPGTATYVGFGYETAPTTGTPHLQGYLVFTTRRTLGSARSRLPQGIHLQRSRGSPAQAIAYCEKEGDFHEYGDRPVGQGARTDIDRFKAWLQEQPVVPSERVIAQEFTSLYLRYRGNLIRLAEFICPQPVLEIGEPRAWQQALIDVVADDPVDDRSITFYVDETGGIGKSWLMRKILTQFAADSQCLGTGRFQDLTCAVDVESRIFLVDVPRGGMEYLSYNFLEKLKDRVVFSSKFKSQTKILRNKPHVIVFSNEHPDETKMTPDRYQIITDFNV